VPKAIPGSMRITMRPGRLSTSLHGGATTNRAPTSTGCQFFFHSPSQSRASTSPNSISRTLAEGSA
jgi:hypothetical protein